MDYICKKCGCELDRNCAYYVGEALEDVFCYECAESIAIEAYRKGESVYIEDCREYADIWELCTWCEQLFPLGELRKERDMGHLCDQCIEGICSRGEKLYIEYGG